MSMSPLREKEQGDAALIEGRFTEACASYSAALDTCPDNTAILLNRSLAALRAGNAEMALRDAAQAAQLLASMLPSESVPTASPLQMSKARFRQGLAFMQLGRAPEAVAIYRTCAKGYEKDPALQNELSKAMEHCTLQWLAQHWARQIAHAQKPILLSKRDGKLLKPVPSELRLKPEKLQACLESALQNKVVAAEARSLLCNAWGKGKRLGRGEVALMRAHVYLVASRPEQALKDARTAVAYGSRDEEQSTWSHAHAAHSNALEGLKDPLMAALAMQRAVEHDNDEPMWLKERDRLLLLIPDQPATILQEEGSRGLESWLAAEKERALPEFKRKRPKYYYYYEWMKERIGTHCGALPEPVLDKLLNIEAGELDTLLTYPAGVQAKAEQLLDVLEKHGAEYLETWRLPPLTWSELEELKANAAVYAIEGSGTGERKMLEGMAPPPGAAAAVDTEDVMFDDDDEEDLDAVD